VDTPPLPEENFLMVEIPTPKPYIFMIRVTRQIKYLIAQAPGVISHPLPEVNFLNIYGLGVGISTISLNIFYCLINVQLDWKQVIST
jgi:hypothetical protein